MFAKIVPVVFGEKTYYMAYSAWAMFQISDLSEEKQIMEILMDFQAEGFPLFCKAVEIMSKAAENIRAYEGEEKGNVLLADQVMAMAGPMDLLNLKRALAEAVASGYGREIGGLKEEVDLGLCELEKKTDPPVQNFCH